MTEDTYWRRVNETTRYGAILAESGLITQEEAIGATFSLLARLLSIKLMAEARSRRQEEGR